MTSPINNIDKIILEHLGLNKEDLESIKTKARNKEIKPEEYLRQLIKSDTNVMYLARGFAYNLTQRKLYDPKHDVIELTRIESKLMHFLCINSDSIVSNKEIAQYVWQKEASIFTIRNFIKKIRDKTHRSLIKNMSNHGYSIEERK